MIHLIAKLNSSITKYSSYTPTVSDMTLSRNVYRLRNFITEGLSSYTNNVLKYGLIGLSTMPQM